MSGSVSSSVSRPGRNEYCACGSGKKFKRCCGASQAPEGDTAGSFFRVASVLTAVMLLLGGVAVARVLLGSEDDVPQRVWSAEHGHWHVVGGKDGTHSVAPGTGWDPEKGQAQQAPTLAERRPQASALEDRRQAETDAAKAKAAAAVAQ